MKIPARPDLDHYELTHEQVERVSGARVNTKGDFIVDGTREIPVALGFLKDWVTAVTTLQTAAIGAVGFVFVGQAPPPLNPLAVAFVILAVVASGASILFGAWLLYMLPGCSQRIPLNGGNDIYAMRTFGDATVGGYARSFSGAFALGIVFYVAFVATHLLTRTA